MKLTATTTFGLEDLLAEELVGIGATNIQKGSHAITFEGDKSVMYRANLELRTALRILKPFLEFDINSAEDLYKQTYAFDWGNLLSPATTFAITSAVHSDLFSNSNFISMKAKDAIVDKLRFVFSSRPNIDLANPDIRLHLRINMHHCTFSIDTSGNSLHKRGYRIAQGPAPINEVLAAGMLMLAGWTGETNLIDPMCGSATILMEAAAIAKNIAPGILNDNFGFMKQRDFNPELWKTLKMEAISRQKEFKHTIYGFDSSPKAIKLAEENISGTDLFGSCIKLKTKNISSFTPEYVASIGSEGVLVLNPPYGERLSRTDITSLYHDIGDSLKQNFQGYSAWIISGSSAGLKSIGLRPSQKIKLYNGDIECRYERFDLYSGSKKFKSTEKAD